MTEQGPKEWHLRYDSSRVQKKYMVVPTNVCNIAVQ